MNDHQPKAKSRWRFLPYAFVIGIALLVVFFCSGLHFPIWGARGTLDDRLARELNVTLPASSRVTHAVRVATRDPAQFYAIEMDAPDVLPFMDKVRATMNGSRDRDASSPWFEPVPDWWKPETLPQVKRLDGFHHDEGGGYTWFYSPRAATVYVFWCRT
jgi:hypothetical protein